MKYVKILPNDTLSDLTERVGYQNIDQILADNGLSRTPKIGRRWHDIYENAIHSEQIAKPQDKILLLNKFVENFDIYEEAAFADEDTWKMLIAKNSFPDYLYISDRLESSVPDSYNVIGNKVSVPPSIFNAVNTAILNGDAIDASLFTEYSTVYDPGLLIRPPYSTNELNPMSWFKLPDDQIILYSSILDNYINIPVYPEEVDDARIANYTQMPDLLYQYEPWQMYQSSGPRSNMYTFHMHRDMWTGDHRDGKANELIRFCEAQLYPKYNGSAVITPTVILYIAGKSVISGIMTQVGVNWSGPIGLDGWYLEFTLSLSITEVSTEVLDHFAVLTKPLIG